MEHILFTNDDHDGNILVIKDTPESRAVYLPLGLVMIFGEKAYKITSKIESEGVFEYILSKI